MPVWGDTLPCFADGRGCLVADRAKGRCRLASAFEYLAQSRGTRYRWQRLSRSLGAGSHWLVPHAEGEAPATAVVVVGHVAPNKWLLAARARHNGALVVGYLAVNGLGSVVEDGGVVGCDPRPGPDSPVVSARYDVRMLVKIPANSP
ncbi:uncharacterized protein LOC144119903 [Amblyomma americanum]